MSNIVRRMTAREVNELQSKIEAVVTYSMDTFSKSMYGNFDDDLTKLKQKYDPSNIPGSKLAEIGRKVLGMTEGTGSRLSDKDIKKYTSPYKLQEGDLTDIAWLNARIDEICRKGKI